MNKPIRLTPQYKEMIWGGDGLRTIFNRPIPSDKTGESWEIHSDNDIIGENKKLKDIQKDESLVGKRVAALSEFPLLVKIITAEDDLSIQVHPNDEYAQRVENRPYGKTECWYILDAPAGAELVVGIKEKIKDKQTLREMIDAGKIEETLGYIPVKKGDFLFIPAGLIHAITKGVTILEVQQTSDTTYRLYDYNRMGLDGKPRELHLEKALDVINLTPTPNPVAGKKEGNRTVFTENAYFTVEKYELSGSEEIKLKEDTIAIFTSTRGVATLTYGDYKEVLNYGDSVIVPVGVSQITVSGDCEVIKSSY